MSNATDRDHLEPAQAIQYYMGLSLASLGLILLVTYQKGLGYWSLLPLLVGLLVLLTRWSLGPPILLLAVATVLNIQPQLPESAGVGDFVLAGAVLAYSLAHYRLRSLLVRILPPDPRLREASLGHKRGIQRKRSAGLVSKQEIGGLVLGIPIWAGVGLTAWKLIPDELGNPGLPAPLWRLIWLAWLLVVGGLVTAGLVCLWNRREMTFQESTLFLQDIVWRETRREQRQVNRWLAWAGIRNARRGKAPEGS